MLYPKLLIGWFIPLFVTGILLYLIIHQSKNNWLSDISARWLLIGSMVLFLLLIVHQYSLEIYPNITEAVGGGAGVDVSLVFDNESAQTAVQLKFPLNNTTNFTTQPLRLLGENDKNYYFRIPDNKSYNFSVIRYDSFHAVEIDKGLIKGMIYNASVNLSVS